MVSLETEEEIEMSRLSFRYAGIMMVVLLLLLMPALSMAQPEQEKGGAPPLEQPLVSEGVFAVRLGIALAVVTTDDEVEAETRLAEVGILPRNGWIADYPVTPDIYVELHDSVGNAAAAGRLSMNRDEALKKLADAALESGLSVRPYTPGAPYEPTAASCAKYPNPAMINESYAREGAPVVTYYCPPPDYYYLYSWVPSPFWWSDLWFPGFFILLDFNKVVHVHHRAIVIRNHFRDARSHRAFRIDPAERFRGRTYGGIGVSHPKDFLPTGVQRGERTIFNEPRATRPSFRGTDDTPTRGGERISPSTRGDERIAPGMRGGERGGPSSGGRGGSRERGGGR